MKIIIQNLDESMISALRRCGYHFERTLPETGEVSAARSFGPGGFPRFHAYVKMINPSTGSGLVKMQINLHLDQKRPSYKGTSAHAGEYEGELIEQEVTRIKSILSPSQ